MIQANTGKMMKMSRPAGAESPASERVDGRRHETSSLLYCADAMSKWHKGWLRKRESKVNLGLLALTVCTLTSQVMVAPLPTVQKCSSILTLTLLMLAYIGLADPSLVALIRQVFHQNQWRPVVPQVGLWIIFLGFAASTGRFELSDTILVLGYLLLPMVLIQLDSYFQKEELRLSVFLCSAILAIWLPVEFGWLPTVAMSPHGGVSLSLLLGVISTLHLFLVVRKLEGMGYSYVLNGRDWKIVSLYFSLFMAFFAIPLGISLQFSTSAEQVEKLWLWPLRALAIFFTTAVPEEILFRGIIHNLIQRTLRGRIRISLVLSSIIFGLAHANNQEPPLIKFTIQGYGTVDFPWVYVLLATIAGVFYGLAYVRTGKLTTAALVHCLVDTWWSLFFQN